MNLSYLLDGYQAGTLCLPDLQALLDAQKRVSAYYERLAAIGPRTDFITDLLSLLLAMQEAFTQRINRLHSFHSLQ
ncbi:hypothetical protein GO755_04930 [Spirosoma sp. HMF4905]|uniref:Uncharacterized protein n=1 Tax=Spirosoma arboris TaxID=2682092 RepID=A0A7K1S6Z0_9BACT|nr:hypothetical protein [Spirosoma arboris]MVM29368.1 hypothetical protein [Spirosoma arboris]